jgi:hypothetical protein
VNITGKARVYNFEDKGNYAKASLQVGKKKPDGTWDNMWFNAKFVKNVPSTLEKGQQIDIKSGLLESWQSDKKITYTTIVIFDYELLNKSEFKSEPIECSDADDLDILPF